MQETKNIVMQLENELPGELSLLQTSLKEAEKSLCREEQAVQDCRRKVDEAHLMKQQVSLFQNGHFIDAPWGTSLGKYKHHFFFEMLIQMINSWLAEVGDACAAAEESSLVQ